MCGDPDDARDVLQETMLAMARRVEALQAAAALPTWLYTVARSFCIKRRRGRPRPESLDDAGARGLQVADPGRGPEERVAGQQLEAAMFGSIVITLDPIFSGLAWSFIFGIFATTAFSLVVVPVVYFLIYRRRAASPAD